MTTERNDDPRPILQRIKTIVPGWNEAVEAIQAEHDVSKRLLKLMVLMHANLAVLGEIIDQAMLNSTDLTMAQETLVSDQKSSMRDLERLADKTTLAKMVTQNLEVWLKSDSDSIRHVLEIVDLPKLSEAAAKLPIVRLAEIVVTLQDAMQGYGKPTPR